MKTLKLIALAAVLAATPACKKKDKDKPADTSGQMQGSGTAAGSGTGAGTGDGTGTGEGTGSAAGDGAGTGAGTGDQAATTPGAPGAPGGEEYIQVLAEHKEKKPDDPVVVNFKKYTVTKASFDPAKIEGGSATIEIDLTSLESGKDKRDKHLQSPDYLNVPKFAKIVIDVANVKKKEGNTYTADAKVNAVGVEKKYPVTFEVVEAKDDWVKIKGEHKFPRSDFKVGKDPKDPNESVAPELTFRMQLTLKKT